MKKCIACKKEIEKEATYCHHCSNHQQNWKNWLPHIATFIALVTFVGSVGFYVLEKTTNVVSNWAWKDEITVISYDSAGSLTVRNSGDGDVFLERIDVEANGFALRSSKTLNTTVSKDSFSIVPLGDSIQGGVIAGITEEQWSEIKNRTYSNVEDQIYNTGHGKLLTLKKHLGDSLRTFPATATLVWYSIKSGDVQQTKIECQGIFINVNDDANIGMQADPRTSGL